MSTRAPAAGMSTPAPAGGSAPAPGAGRPAAPAARRKAAARAAPPGNTGAHVPAPNAYVMALFARTNPLTQRRTPLTADPGAHAAALQRLVHHEGSRPPNRKILQTLRLLTFYPPVDDILPELVKLLDSRNLHIVRLVHYHLRAAAPIPDQALYREIVEALERQVLSPAPSRRAAATTTLTRVFQKEDVSRATDFVVDVFNSIGGARVKPVETPVRKVAGVELPGRPHPQAKPEKKTVMERLDPKALLSRKIVSGETYDAPKEEKKERRGVDDGAGGELTSAVGNAEFIKSKFGKMLVGHTVFAALRRLNRVATSQATVHTYLVDSGLLSVVTSTVRHTVALLEWRSTVSPGAVARYLVGRLPHKNPPPHKRLHLQELGARVYFARLLSALAEDPNLSVYIPDRAPKQASRARPKGPETLKGAVVGTTVKAKASGLFNFLFNRDRVSEAVGAVKQSTSALTNVRVRPPKRDDPLGVEFAEALINLLKNASIRVLIEALRGLSRRRWTTWFEAPIPQGALYNSPELNDGEAYGGTVEGWGMGDDDDDDDDDEGDDDELGAYEDDLAGVEDGPKESLPAAKQEAVDPELDDMGSAGSKEGWFSRMNVKRKERRDARVDKTTPFYLRKVGQGMVPALEVILRRLNAALLNDEPVRRFAAADAVVVLARAKIYGHTEEDHTKLRKAQSSVAASSSRASSRALVPVSQSGPMVQHQGSSFNEEKHAFQALVRPLAELVEEDPNQFVRGRAAVALLFIIASGAGRTILEPDELDLDVSDEALDRSARLHKTPLLLRYFRNFVTHKSAGTGVGLKLMSELVDYLVYEVLDISPDLAPSAVELTELWAVTHPTVGVCGRLGAIWEKVLGMGQGGVVGKSIFRAVDCSPRTERVASAAVIFLRRRTLDLAVITVGSSEIAAAGLSEPLPRAVGVEMEKYLSLLWHTALLGPSAECRTFAVEALGGAAVLGGEPFRCCTYERLVELVRIRGFGLKVPAEQVLNCLDMIYFARERFSEARSQNRIARDGSNKSKEWLELVWRLAAEASSAAQIILGVPPPTGWQPLGPGAAADLGNAEGRFGDVRDRQDDEKLKDASVATASAPGSVPLLAGAGGAEAARRIGSGGLGDVPPALSVRAAAGDGMDQASRYRDDVDAHSGRAGANGMVPHDRRRSRSQSPGWGRSARRSDEWRDDRYEQGERYDRGDRYERDDRYEPGDRYERDDRYDGEDYRVGRREHSEAARDPSPVRERTAPTSSGAGPSAQNSKAQQEREDYELAKRLQDSSLGGESGGVSVSGSGSGAGGVLERAGGAAEKLLKRGAALTQRALKR